MTRARHDRAGLRLRARIAACLATGLSIAGSFGAGPATSAGAGDALPGPEWRSFSATFEASDPSTRSLPTPALDRGRRGRALRIGQGSGAKELAQRGVVDLARPGAITLWVRPSGWSAPSPSADYVPVIRVVGAGSAALVVERDRRYPGRTTDVWIAGYFSLASRGEAQLQLELPAAWQNDDWHFVAFQWDATGFSLQLDGTKPARLAVAGVDLAAEFPKPTSTLLVGSASPEAILVDDLAVWSRPLTRAELDALRSR